MLHVPSIDQSGTGPIPCAVDLEQEYGMTRDEFFNQHLPALQAATVISEDFIRCIA